MKRTHIHIREDHLRRADALLPELGHPTRAAVLRRALDVGLAALERSLAADAYRSALAAPTAQ